MVCGLCRGTGADISSAGGWNVSVQMKVTTHRDVQVTDKSVHISMSVDVFRNKKQKGGN